MHPASLPRLDFRPGGGGLRLPKTPSPGIHAFGLVREFLRFQALGQFENALSDVALQHDLDHQGLVGFKEALEFREGAPLFGQSVPGDLFGRPGADLHELAL